MAVEIYTTEIDTRDNGLVETEDEMLQEQEELCRELGFERQVSRLRYMRKLIKREIPFKKLSAKEYEIYKKFLPRLYGESDFSSYNFDIIPSDVLLTLKECRNKRMFDWYDIRTMEQDKDPALFGFIQDDVYLLARWGDALIPFAEMEKSVDNKVRHGKTLYIIELILYFVVTLVFVLFLFAHRGVLSIIM